MHTDQLLVLIKALTSQNKKAFSLYIKQQNKKSLSNYFELYHIYVKLIDKHESEEEIKIALQKQLKRKPHLLKHISKNRSLLKERLFSILLKCEKKEDIEQQIEYSIQVIKVLIKRKLFEHAQQKIEQVKKQAKTFDLTNKMIDLIRLELLLISKYSNKGDLSRQSALIKKLEWNMQLYTKELQFESFFRQISLIGERDAMNLKEENKVGLEASYKRHMIDNFPIKKFEKENRIHLVYWYYRIENLYCRINGTPEKAINYSQALVNYFENSPKLKGNFESLYLKSICSFTRACKANENYSALEESLKKAKQIYELKTNYDALEVSCDIGVLHYLNLKQYEKAIEFADLMELEWKNIILHTSIGKQLWYCRSNLLLFWIIDNKPKFEYWLNIGLDIPRSYKGLRLYFGLRMFALLSDFDNNQMLTFKEKVEALLKTLQYNDILTEFQKIVLQHFRELYNINFSSKYINLNKTEKLTLRKKTFQSLKDILKALKFKTPPTNYEEILLWCESHLQNKAVKEVFEAEG